MKAFILRPASREDFPAIRSLIHSVHINPFGLNWQRFIVAEAMGGGLIGCGQIKTHADGSHELASIAVVPAWQGNGVARAIIEKLLDSHQGTLYLTCRSHLRVFYEKFGFIDAPDNDLPPYFKRIRSLVRYLARLHLTPDGLLVMRRLGSPAGKSGPNSLSPDPRG